MSETLERALNHEGPALIHLHAPSPRRHGFATDRTLERSRDAVETRVFPLFRYDPHGEGVFGSRLDLDGNADPLLPWASGGDAGGRTAADWALGERRFAHLFSPIADGDSGPTPLADYLELGTSERRKRTPFVERAGNGEAPRRFRVDPELVRVSGERLAAWRMLQELAGLVTPFTARVRAESEARVEAEHQAALEAQADAYETRIQGLRAELREETRLAMRERLMQLAGYRGAADQQGRAE